ncbi:AzlC family ABC transporter permease [Ruminococcaceae bacterium OttesenSCG-928-I18]|nr:AzlC family ABC transporter permease [Ruminococcaceae bacterium OttesenSCG-928-I18]
MTTEEKKQKNLAAVRAAFPHTIPVLTGYVFMGMAFGILLGSKGFGPLWAFCMALFVFAGSGQFLAVGLMASGFHPLTALLLTLMVNARHVFYGIPLLERFKHFGRAKYYMIFALTDETFALLCSVKPPAGVSERRFNLAICALDHSYWITGCTLGGILGTALPINTAGIDFVMTALFVVIFLEQWRERQNRRPALIGLGISILCRVLFGPQWFILAAMAALVLVFGVFKRPLERGMQKG